MKWLAIAALVLGASCKKKSEAPRKQDTRADAAVAKIDPCSKAKPEGPLAWIADDYPSAIACAKQKKLPVVLDLWAPWCHTCLSMQTTVFVDPSFNKDKERFVFASLDTDREVNAPPLAKLSISAWPTFYVIGPDETVLARWVGSATVAQFHDFLDAGARATSGGVAGADAHLLGAERALAVKDFATAETELNAALAAAPADWSRRPDVLGSLLLTKYKKKDYDGCLAFAEQNLDKTGNTPTASDFLGTAMSCAEERAKDQAPRVKKLRERAVARWQQLLADEAAPFSADDRSDAMLYQRETLEALGKKDEAKALAEKQAAHLDKAAREATSPMQAMTFNWQRAEVYVYLGRPLDLVPALEQSAKDLPNEYDPRARLGWVYFKAGKLDEAARWTNEALKLAYGPRKARVLVQRADIAKAAGDTATEKTFREMVVKHWESLPASQQNGEQLGKAREALAAMTASGSGSGSGSAK